MSDKSGASDASSDTPALAKPNTNRGRRGRKPKTYTEAKADEDMDDTEDMDDIDDAPPQEESVQSEGDEDEADLDADEYGCHLLLSQPPPSD